MPAYPQQPTAHISDALDQVPIGTAVSTVAKRLLELFTSGAIPAGSRLPPERRLAQTLGIGRSAVREALAALEILGIVDVRPGSGTYLRGSASELLPETLNWGLMLDSSRTGELIEVRGELEVFAARRAAERATPEILADLGAHVDAMRAALADRSRFIEADLKFHLGVASAAQNQVLADLLRSVRSLLRLWVERGLQTEEEAATALVEHADVLEAIRGHDADSAGEAMQRHMRTAAERLEQRVAGDEDREPA